MMNAEEELLFTEQSWNIAMEKNDPQDIGTYMSDDWIIVGTDGGITTKEQFLSTIASGDLSHNRMDNDFVRVKVYKDTGILTSRGTSAGMYKGAPFEFYEWSASTYVRENGSWICVHTMLTPAHLSK